MIKSSVITTFFKHFCIISWKSSAEFKYQQINYVIVYLGIFGKFSNHAFCRKSVRNCFCICQRLKNKSYFWSRYLPHKSFRTNVPTYFNTLQYFTETAEYCSALK